jgi:cbb3-type cytochrome oxidase subunit 3
MLKIMRRLRWMCESRCTIGCTPPAARKKKRCELISMLWVSSGHPRIAMISRITTDAYGKIPLNLECVGHNFVLGERFFFIFHMKIFLRRVQWTKKYFVGTADINLVLILTFFFYCFIYFVYCNTGCRSLAGRARCISDTSDAACGYFLVGISSPVALTNLVSSSFLSNIQSQDMCV